MVDNLINDTGVFLRSAVATAAEDKVDLRVKDMIRCQIAELFQDLLLLGNQLVEVDKLSIFKSFLQQRLLPGNQLEEVIELLVLRRLFFRTLQEFRTLFKQPFVIQDFYILDFLFEHAAHRSLTVIASQRLENQFVEVVFLGRKVIDEFLAAEGAFHRLLIIDLHLFNQVKQTDIVLIPTLQGTLQFKKTLLTLGQCTD